MTRYKKALIATVLLTAPMLAGASGMAMAQMRQPMGMGMGRGTPAFDPAQLPEFKGKVAQYTLSPRGEVDGLILADGTEVQVPPHLSTALVFSVKPGDSVSIRGLKAKALPMVSAVTITNDASGAVIGGDTGFRPGGPTMEASGKIKEILHTPRGDVGGALLEDGTVIRMPPPAAQKLSNLLVVGQTIAVKGMGISSPLGKSIGAFEVGPSADKLTKIDMPHWDRGSHGPRGDHGPEGMKGGMMGDHGPDGRGPNGAPPPSRP